MSKFILFLYLLSSSAFAHESILLNLGERKTLRLAGASAIWVENRQVLQVSVNGAEVSLKALQVGSSLIRLGSRSELVQVLPPVQKDSMERLQKAIRSLVGLRTDVRNGNLQLKGRLYSLLDWQKVAAQDLRYQMAAQISPGLQEEAQNYFRQLQKQEHLPRQNVIFSSETEVRIHPKSIYRARYERLFTPYGIQVVLDEDIIESAPTIKVQITVAEVKKTFALKYGLNWPGQYKATVLPTSTDLWSADPGWTANTFENQGLGRILASPNIICRSGKEAEFTAGGEFPIKIMNYKIQDIVWKRYGILLKVRPKADSSGKISLSIDTEVSTLDPATKVDDVPGILTNHVSSHFDLNRPQTIALSGLLKNEESKGHQGLPFLSRLPILGPLFSSQDFIDNKSELIVFVRPTVLEDENDESLSQPNNSPLGDVSWK